MVTYICSIMIITNRVSVVTFPPRIKISCFTHTSLVFEAVFFKTYCYWLFFFYWRSFCCLYSKRLSCAAACVSPAPSLLLLTAEERRRRSSAAVNDSKRLSHRA